MEDKRIDVVKLKSYAKINLYLDIGSKLKDGYHNIETIIQTVDLYDEIIMKSLNEPVLFIDCDHPEVPTDNKSIMYKAAAQLLANTGRGLKIILKKNIPLSSGLGGGSSNVASIMIGINKLFSLKISESLLIDMAAKFGMDIPFFIIRGTVLAQGRGEKIAPLSPVCPSIPLILINPGIKVSTEWAYRLFDQLSDNKMKQVLGLTHLLKKNGAIRPSEIYKIVYNRFDAVLDEEYPVVKEIKNRLKSLGAVAVALSGSGSTVYGLFEEHVCRDVAYQKIKGEYPFTYRTRTVQARKVIF